MTDYQEWLSALKPGDSWHCVISTYFSGVRVARAAQLPRLLASVTQSEAMSWPGETVEQIAQLILEARRKKKAESGA